MSREGVPKGRLLAGTAAMLVLGVGGFLSIAVTRAPGWTGPTHPGWVGPTHVGAVHAGSIREGSTRARAARLLSINDTGHLLLLHASGEVLDEEGTASGTLPGTVKVHMTVGANVTASFTIAARGGSIEGHGSAALHSSGRYSSFGGTLTVSHGSGRYAHARGGGGLYGVINRRTDALTVQTTGDLHY